VGTRYDVSNVPLQGGYVAKTCPVKAQNDALLPCEPLPPSLATERRFQRGREFEERILGDLKAAHPNLLAVTGATSADKEKATLAAMTQGADLIFGGRLPADHVGRRVGKPDLLVRSSVDGSPAYHPVDVKHHRTLEAFTKAPARCSELAQPTLAAAQLDAAMSARKRRDDLLQLAHYQRMLQACGFAADNCGGIIGVEAKVTWHDLDAPLWLTPSSTGKKKRRSTLEIYDFEFDFRLDMIAVANRHLEDPSVAPLLVPVRIAECPECPWWAHCGPQLEAGTGDVSLVPKVGWHQWSTHRAHGVRDRAQLAKLDPRTASLVADGIDVQALMAIAQSADPRTPLLELIGRRRPSQAKRLEESGVHTAADVSALSAGTATYSGSGLASLPVQIDLARAVLGSEPVYRRRGLAALEVPRADVELDLDLENVEEGVYLWGALVTDRADAGLGAGYKAFVAWERMTPELEVRLYEQLWIWLKDLRLRVHEAGKTFRAFCYNSGVEGGHLRRLSALAGRRSEVDSFLDGQEWVDLLRVFTSQLITGGGAGLKVVAPLAGYTWPVKEPGGEESMLLYETAITTADENEKKNAQRWLLDYNRGDVEATLALRTWMDERRAAIPSIETVDPIEL
jgi:predicted RecB family nuclease